MTDRFQEVRDLRASIIEPVPEEDRAMVGLRSNFILNTTPGIRPSSALRRAVADYQRLGRHGLEARRESDNLDALRACGCPTCNADAEKIERQRAMNVDSASLQFLSGPPLAR